MRSLRDKGLKALTVLPSLVDALVVNASRSRTAGVGGVEAGMRGPVLLKWVRELLADRDERLAQERRVLPDPHGTPGRS